MTLSRPELIDLLDRYHIHPSRALGQNFVADPNTVRRIARLAQLETGQLVVEVGAGVGSLTLALAETGARVTAVELDRRLAPALRSVVEPAGVRVVVADAMELDWDELLGPEPGRWVLVANLPYNVATPLVIGLLERAPAIARMLVMVQREVAERLSARPGDPAYGAASVKVSYWAAASLAGRVPASVFVPRPKVESALVRVERRSEPAVDASAVPYEELFSLVRAGFSTRRKMLRRSLAGLVEPGDFAAAGLRPQSRPEELGVEEWGRLAACRRARPSGPPPS